MEAYISAAVAEVIDTWPKDELTDPRLTGMEAAEAWVRAWITFPTHKPPASVKRERAWGIEHTKQFIHGGISIDDRCITFRGEWPPLEVLKSFRPWNKLGPRETKNLMEGTWTPDMPCRREGMERRRG